VKTFYDALTFCTEIGEKAEKNTNCFCKIDIIAYISRVAVGVRLGYAAPTYFFSKVGCVGSVYFCTGGAYDVFYTQSK